MTQAILLLVPLLAWPRLVTEAEISNMKAEIEARLAANRARVCERPVLRGQPLPGSADADLVQILDPTGPMRGCLVAAKAEGIGQALHDRPAKGATQLEPARPLDAPASRIEVIARLEAACAELPAIVDRAVRHADACSPFLTGRGKLASPIAAMRLGAALTAVARAAARAGRPADAFWLALQGVQLSQDLGRGGTTMVLALLSANSAEPLLALALLLADSVDPAVALTAVEKLIASEPHPSGFLEADFIDVVATTIIPDLEPDLEAAGRQGGMEGGLLTFGADPADDTVLAWIAAREGSDNIVAACPTGASPEACVAGLRRLRAAVEARTPPSPWEIAMQVLGGTPPRLAIRRAAIDVLKGIASPVFERYVLRYWLRRTALDALATQLGIHRDDGRCPAEVRPMLALRATAAGIEITPRRTLWLTPNEPPFRLKLACTRSK